MDIHRYNKVTGFINKTVNVTNENAINEFNQVSGMILSDPMFCKYYRITLVDNLSNRIVKDSDNFKVKTV